MEYDRLDSFDAFAVAPELHTGLIVYRCSACALQNVTYITVQPNVWALCIQIYVHRRTETATICNQQILSDSLMHFVSNPYALTSYMNT